MRLICVPSLVFLISLLFHITNAIEFVDTDSLEQPTQNTVDESNIDDTSLFRGVENAIDEDFEDDDAYRILQSLQDVNEDDYSEEDEDDQVPQHSSSKDIKARIQPEEDEQYMEQIDDEEEEQEEDEEEEEDDEDEDFSTDTFPEFKNNAAADFFDNFPLQPPNNEGEKGVTPLDEQEDEADSIDTTNDAPEEEDDEYDDESTNNNNIDSTANHNIPLPNIPIKPIQEEDTIPWHRPDSKDRLVANDNDNSFNQQSNYNPTLYVNPTRSTAGFKLWHVLFLLLIVVAIYNRLSTKKVYQIMKRAMIYSIRLMNKQNSLLIY